MSGLSSWPSIVEFNAYHCCITALYCCITVIIGCLSLWLSGLGHSACWPDGLRALTGLTSTPGLEGSYSARLG